MAQKKILMVLTLERHRHGIWITKLIDAFEKLETKPWTTVQVISLESLFPMDPNQQNSRSLFLPSSQQVAENETIEIVGLVNRVSDAAPPELALLGTSVLQLAVARHIPVWNGPASYALCTQKWCHHALFRQAQLSCPATRVVMNVPVDDDHDDATQPLPQHYHQMLHEASQQLIQQDHQPLPHLIKPNAGGFGAGIRLVTSSNVEQVATSTSLPPTYTITLVQSYHVPVDHYIYRIWLLCGKVQCAMRRRITPTVATTTAAETAATATAKAASPAPEATEEFTSGCAGGTACARKPTTPQQQQQQPPTTGASPESISASSEFTSGCAGGAACAWKPTSSKTNSSATGDSDPGLAVVSNDTPLPLQSATPSVPTRREESPFEIWNVSDDVRLELEEQLVPILPQDFHAGSVEFLYTTITHQDNDDTARLHQQHQQQRLYFDLNLLSTLPVREQEQELQSNHQRFVWDELATAVVAVVSSVPIAKDAIKAISKDA